MELSEQHPKKKKEKEKENEKKKITMKPLEKMSRISRKYQGRCKTIAGQGIDKEVIGKVTGAVPPLWSTNFV